MKRVALARGALVALALATTTGARPQDEWVAQVRRILQHTGRILEAHGYSMKHRILTGALRTGQHEFVGVDLASSTQYQILGACDSDCSDMDLELYDPAGNQVDRMEPGDEEFMVEVTPDRPGTYRVKVIMASCSSEPCRYGIGVFGK